MCSSLVYKLLCSMREKNLHYCSMKASLQCRSVCNATSCVCRRTTGNSTFMLGKRTHYLEQTSMGFCSLPRRVQTHTRKQFRTCDDLGGTTHYIPRIQHCWNKRVQRVLESWFVQGYHMVVTLIWICSTTNSNRCEIMGWDPWSVCQWYWLRFHFDGW